MLDGAFAGLLGVPLSLHDDKKPTAVTKPTVFNIFSSRNFFL